MTSPLPSDKGGRRPPALRLSSPPSHRHIPTDELSAEDQQLEVGEDDSELAVDVDEELVLANGDSDDDDEHDRRGGGQNGKKASRFSLPSLGRKKGGRYSRVIPEGGELSTRNTSDSGRRAAAAAVAAVTSVTSALSSSASPSSSLPPPPSATTSIKSCLTVSNCCLCLVFSLTMFISGFVGWTIARHSLQQPSAASHPTTIVVSLDGFRSSYYSAYPELSPNLHSISKAGVYVRRLVPAFPSSTFPNHYTLMTGLLPPEHGILANRMYNAQTGLSFETGSNSTLDPVWWKGEPLWVTARRWGLKTAALQWPGTDVLIDNQRPDIWSLYNHSLPASQLLDTVLGWLDNQSCQLCLLYFPDVDRAGHQGGPNSPLVQAAVQLVDGLVGQLIAGLSSRGLLDSVNLVVLSDHGMTAVNTTVDSSTTHYIDDYVNDTALYRLVDWGANAALLPLCSPACAQQLYNNLTAIPNVTVYWNDSIPDALHYSHNPLIQPILIVCDLGFLVTDRGSQHQLNLSGAHGYLPWLEGMSALMTLRGPSLVQSYSGSELAEVHSVDVYALLCYMMRIAPAVNDGNITQWIPLINV